jgi:hypothetical protein
MVPGAPAGSLQPVKPGNFVPGAKPAGGMSGMAGMAGMEGMNMPSMPSSPITVREPIPVATGKASGGMGSVIFRA